MWLVDGAHTILTTITIYTISYWGCGQVTANCQSENQAPQRFAATVDYFQAI